MQKPYQVNTMASGNLSLDISADVSWESFPAEAEAFLKQVGGRVIRKADSPVERVWEVTVYGQQFWLAYDDFGGMSLDAMSSQCNEVVLELLK